MPSFKTPYEQRKWTKLEQQARKTFDKLKNGEGTSKDLKQAQLLVAQYGAVASQVFQNGVDAINKIAEDRIARITNDRAKKGKAEINTDGLLELAITKAIQSEGVELAATVEDIVIKQLREQDDRFELMIDRKLSRFFKNVPTQDDLVAAAELAGEMRFGGVYQRMEEAAYRGLRRLIMEFRGVSGVEQVLEPENPTGRYTPSALASDFIKTQPQGLPSSSPALMEEKQADTRESLLEDINEKLDDVTNPSNQDKRDERKATNWWRKLKSFTGGAWDRAKSVGGKFGLGAGLLALLGRFLLTELTGGKMIEKIQSYLNFDKMKEYGTQFLDFVTKNAKSLATWIADKINPFHESDEDLVRKHSNAANTNAAGAEYATQQRDKFIGMAEEASKNGNETAATHYRSEAEKWNKRAEQKTKFQQQNIDKASNAQQRISDTTTGSSSGNVNITGPAGSTPPAQGEPSPGFTTGEGGAAFGRPNRRARSSTVADSEINPSKPITTKDAAVQQSENVMRSMKEAQGASILSLDSIPYSTSVDPSFGLLNSAVLIK